MDRRVFPNQKASLIICVISLFLILLATRQHHLVVAQVTNDIIWTIPEQITFEGTVLQQITMTVDDWGGVHVFWVQNIAGDITHNSPRNMIYYIHSSDGQTWSIPTDIIADLGQASFDAPQAVVDQQGQIHLLWSEFSGLYYSRSDIRVAQNPQAWQTPQRLTSGDSIRHTRIAVDSMGWLHIVFNRANAGENVLHMRSEDGGQTWSRSETVSNLLPVDIQAPNLVQLAIDSQDVLHVVWAESYPPRWVGQQILYAYSIDHGATWSTPFPLSELVTEPAWNEAPTLSVDNNDTLHVVWVCGSVRRCYRQKTVHSDIWTESQQIFSQLLGVSGWDALTSDPYGHVYWLGALREPQGVYFSSFNPEQGWQDPPEMLLSASEWGRLGHSHFFQLALTEGNQLHALMVEGDKGPIWYLQGHTDQAPKPAAPPLPLLESETPPTLPTQSATTPVIASTTVAPGYFETNPPPAASRSNSLLTATIPALLLVLIVISVKQKHRRSR